MIKPLIMIKDNKSRDKIVTLPGAQKLTTSSAIILNLLNAHSRLRQFLATENPLKMIKNAFHFMLKALFVLKIFLVMWKNDLIRDLT